MNRSPLHYAAQEGDIAAVVGLVNSGANLDAADDGGYTPLHFASQNNHPAVVKLLLERGAEVDSVDSWGNTPLWRAVFNYRDSGETILALRAAGANPHHVNKAGRTPVQLARTIANYDSTQFFEDLPRDKKPD